MTRTFPGRDESATNNYIFRHHKKPQHAYISFSSYIIITTTTFSYFSLFTTSATLSLHCDSCYPYYDYYDFIVGYF